MVRRRVVGNEIKEQPQAALTKAFTQAGQCGIASQLAMHDVTGDGETGASDVILTQVGQSLLEFLPPLRIAPGKLLASGTVCQTLRNQIQSKPISAKRSSSASGMSSSVAVRPRAFDSPVSHTRVLIW